MKTVFENPLYNFIHDPENNILIFDWTERTAEMDDDDFIEALSNYAGFAHDCQGPGLIVDVTRFKHNMGEKGGKWRNEVGVPRYLQAGSSKLGYVFPKEMLDQLPKGEVSIGDFTDRYFGSREEATKWLINS